MLAALLAAPKRNCLLVDRDFAPGEEPVKVCVAAGRIVDFSKRPSVAHDWHGESVGFFRFGPAAARAVAERSALYVESGREEAEYEEAIRELILEDAFDDRLGFAEVTGLPWTEIDFPEDVVHAERNVLPRLEG
jgi:choline kinase